MRMARALFFTLIALALIYSFLNGIHDSSNIVATVISSRAMSPRRALLLTAVSEFCGPFIFGTAVATTIGHDLVNLKLVNTEMVIAALLSAIGWGLLTWFLGIPSSSSHALFGGIAGAVGAGAGLSALQFQGLLTVLIALLISPLLGLLVGYLAIRVVVSLAWAKGATPQINSFFRQTQRFTSIGLALSHSSNDAPKAMGMMVMGLVSLGYLPQFQVPLWVALTCAGAIALGTGLGGWRLIRTLGAKFYKIRPVHGFSAQLSSFAIILLADLLGGPVSVSQVASSAIMGVGAGERLSKVRWGVARNIAIAWFLTTPVTAVLGMLFYKWL
jgi:PiT family inorganic phosphate transporter